MTSSEAAAARVMKARGTPMKLAVLLLLLGTSLRVAGQRINTVDVGGSTYYISAQSPYNAPLSWFLAYQYCRTIGMELLTEATQEEAVTLRDFLSTNGYENQSFWTSGNQLGSNKWLWMTSGLPYNASFNFWADQKEPLASTSDDSCMLLQSGEWRSAPCTQQHHLICQLTRCFFFNYVRSNTQAADARSTRTTILAPGVRSVSSTAPESPDPSTTPPPPSRRTRRPITANRAIIFPTVVPPAFTKASNEAQAVTEQSETSKPISVEQVGEEVEAHTQQDLDELLRQTAESNTIGDTPTPLLSKLLQPPHLPTLIHTSDDNTDDSITTKIANTDTSGSRTRVDQLERKEVFSWALLPDSPQS